VLIFAIDPKDISVHPELSARFGPAIAMGIELVPKPIEGYQVKFKSL